MPRYATIITDDDGREVVSAIGEFEGAAPQARLWRIEQVASGVLIGMVRDAAGGFCFPQPGSGARPAGLTLVGLKARTKATKPAGTAKPRKPRKKAARSRKPARRVPKAGRAVSASDTAVKAMGEANG
ncbi:hypothetical protein FJ930_20945 [Mesorhizobium sp. B2-4-15]|uniref:hypothetical protein n=1 Tax=Mesorhizobium sp. B2-4-15 TaxID=2589934 RepID=UPI0011516946|nr:hypothetical protein [Mesorhizobium sp. B2-4-15]TPK69862.1 hypothetical protein FJ930_20945 [Mesorhizobium sp. B2-4-15]